MAARQDGRGGGPLTAEVVWPYVVKHALRVAGGMHGEGAVCGCLIQGRRTLTPDAAWRAATERPVGVLVRLPGACFAAEDLARMAKALASARVYHPGLFNVMAERAIALCPAAAAGAQALGQGLRMPSTEQMAQMTFRQRRCALVPAEACFFLEPFLLEHGASARCLRLRRAVVLIWCGPGLAWQLHTTILG